MHPLIFCTGDLNVKLKFEGIAGVAYPQNRPDIDAFEDTTRKGPEITKVKRNAAPMSMNVSSTAREGSQPSMDGIPYVPEFTEEQIRAAFQFIDLDKNDVKRFRQVITNEPFDRERQLFFSLWEQLRYGTY